MEKQSKNKNLVNIGYLTTERQREITSLGGRKSAENRKKRKEIADSLFQEWTVGKAEKICATLLESALFDHNENAMALLININDVCDCMMYGTGKVRKVGHIKKMRINGESIGKLYKGGKSGKNEK